MPSWILLHTHSVMAFIMVATQIGMLLFLVLSKEKTAVKRWMTLNYLASSVWYIDQMIRFSLYPGTEGSVIYKLETILIYSPSLALLMLSNFQIYYLFIQSSFEKERKIMLQLALPFAALLVGALTWNELANDSNVFYFQAISFVWGLLTNIGTLVIALRKVFVNRYTNEDATYAHLLLAGVAVCFLLLSIVNLIFGLYSPIGYWTFFIFIWIGNLMLIVTYLSYSNMFVSFQIKITGFSFVAVVTFIAVVALVYFPPIMPSNISERMGQQQDLKRLFFILFGAIVLIIIMLPSLLKRTLTNPLKQLLKAVKGVNTGNYTVEVPVLYSDEIGSLTRNFNTMTQTLRKTNDQLVEYTNTLTELYTNQQKIQEQTLNHVSQEIHDNVGQLLSLVSVQLNLVAETEGSKNLVLLDARDNISRAMMELRDMAKGMSSERIKVLGLLGSVEQEADRIRRAGLCEVTIQSQGAPIQLEHQKETILFRVIQECLQNIIKHAQAKRIQLLFLYTESTVAISVHDDGKGFLITRENNLSGLGFMNIHHRIELMSGKVVVQSEPGSGTKILIEVPLG